MLHHAPMSPSQRSDTRVSSASTALGRGGKGKGWWPSSTRMPSAWRNVVYDRRSAASVGALAKRVSRGANSPGGSHQAASGSGEIRGKSSMLLPTFQRRRLAGATASHVRYPGRQSSPDGSEILKATSELSSGTPPGIAHLGIASKAGPRRPPAGRVSLPAKAGPRRLQPAPRVQTTSQSR
eukprot:scaffold7392_cov286-Pinguiococcus_pyrenoidosus.AAC.3